MSSGNHPRSARPDPDLDAVMAERRQLINLAYRLLGSLTEAEDVVQETYARWYAMSPSQQAAIESPGAWLTTVASRICLDLLGSARVRRERYVGEWVPEPLPDAGDWTGGPGSAPADPADRVTLDESVGMAFLVVLDSMTPAERVAFMLHDVFGYPFAQVAEVTGRSPAACRQLASCRPPPRPRRPRPRPCPKARHAGIIRDFKAGLGGQGHRRPDRPPRPRRRRDPPTAAAWSRRHSTRSKARSRSRATSSTSCVRAPANLALAEATVNGEPGLVARQDGVTVTVFAFDVAGERIKRIWAVRNPEKLRPWTAG